VDTLTTSLAYSSTLKLAKTSVNFYQTTQRHILEARSHRCVNLISNNEKSVSRLVPVWTTQGWRWHTKTFFISFLPYIFLFLFRPNHPIIIFPPLLSIHLILLLLCFIFYTSPLPHSVLFIVLFVSSPFFKSFSLLFVITFTIRILHPLNVRSTSHTVTYRPRVDTHPH
jgi:hypothetical protein